MVKTRVTAYDVAKRAGVSQTTVSFVLNDVQGANISEKTRQRVLGAAEELGYLPNSIARSLATGVTFTLGLVVTTAADLFLAELVTTVEQFSFEHGYSLLLANSGGDPQRELEAIRTLQEKRVDGIVVAFGHASEEDLRAQKGGRTPIVPISSGHERYACPSVAVEDRSAGRQATQHLLDLGHRRIAHITGRPGEWDSKERRGGYEETLRSYGLEVDERLIVPGTGHPEGGVDAMEQLLALPELPSAVFCYSDLTALGAMQAARAAGLRIPQDLSVVGVDDLSISRFVDPPLTTVSQPIGQIGQIAVQMVLDLIAGDESVDSCVLPVQLVVRGSTMPPSRREP